jgi:pyruvate/2-oxoglutarate/acetoin dehydrogenase E1 component
VTSAQTPIPYSRKLEQLTVPSAEKIVKAVKEILNRN